VKYLLDTNACVAHLRGLGKVAERLRALVPSEVAVCSVVRSELMFGAARSRDPVRERSAAIALCHGLTLVTHNTQEFSRVPDLLLEDWEA
jgi:tRNA(fMet)-specific endonuclease VapC